MREINLRNFLQSEIVNIELDEAHPTRSDHLNSEKHW